MGPKTNLVHFKSVLECLLINSWSSSQHLQAGKRWRVIPSLPSHLVIYFTLVKWFRFGWQDWWGEILALLIYGTAYGIMGEKKKKTAFEYCKTLPWYANNVPVWRGALMFRSSPNIRCFVIIFFLSNFYILLCKNSSKGMEKVIFEF